MTEFDKLFIGGKWVEPSSDQGIEVHSPATGELVGKVPEAPRPTSTQRARPPARPSTRARGHTCRRTSGPPCSARVGEADGGARRRAEVPAGRRDGAAADDRRHDAVRRRRWRRSSTTAGRGHVHLARLRDGVYGETMVLREPIGVVAAVTPWNVPFFLAANKLGPALLAGCTIVLKPAPRRRCRVLRWPSMFAEAGLPEGVLSVVPGGPRGRASTSSRHPGIDKVSVHRFDRGRARRSASSPPRSSSACTLELGGKSRGDHPRGRRPGLDAADAGVLRADEHRPGLRRPDPNPGAAVALRRGRREARAAAPAMPVGDPTTRRPRSAR